MREHKIIFLIVLAIFLTGISIVLVYKYAWIIFLNFINDFYNWLWCNISWIVNWLFLWRQAKRKLLDESVQSM